MLVAPGSSHSKPRGAPAPGRAFRVGAFQSKTPPQVCMNLHTEIVLGPGVLCSEASCGAKSGGRMRAARLMALRIVRRGLRYRMLSV